MAVIVSCQDLGHPITALLSSLLQTLSLSLSPIIDWLIDTDPKNHLGFTLIKPFLDSQLKTYHPTKKCILFTKVLMSDILDFKSNSSLLILNVVGPQNQIFERTLLAK